MGAACWLRGSHSSTPIHPLRYFAFASSFLPSCSALHGCSAFVSALLMSLVILIQDEYLERWYIERWEGKGEVGDFFGSQVVKTPRFQSGSAGSIPDQGTKIPPTSCVVQPIFFFLKVRSWESHGPAGLGRLYVADWYAITKSTRGKSPVTLHLVPTKVSSCTTVCVCVCVCVCVLVAQLYPAFCHPMGCSLPEFSVHGIFQARIIEWFAISFSGGSSWPRDWTWVPCIAGMAYSLPSEPLGKHSLEHIILFLFFS